MLDILYQIIIEPICVGLDVIFGILYDVLHLNLFIVILLISFFINLLCSPLYKKAEKIQNEEREIRNKLSQKVESIKRNFKGDERHMLLSTYYRQNNYHPIMSIRSSLSLLLQIPFFIAAYNFLISVFRSLNEEEIKIFNSVNLLYPDKLLEFGDYSINILPIIMTIINIISAIVYVKNNNQKLNFQILIVPLVFFILLYKSGSGVVIYWTFNNVFSLLRSIFHKNKSYKIYLSMFLVAFLLYFLWTVYSFDIIELLFVYELLILLGCVYFVSKYINFNVNKLYILCCIALSLFIGLVIPSGLIASSPNEFVNSLGLGNPILLLKFPFTISLGIFLFWGISIYYLVSAKYKKYIAVLAYSLIVLFVINYFMLEYPKGLINSGLIYTKIYESITDSIIYNNFFLVLICFVILSFLFKKGQTKILNSLLLIFIFSSILISFFNIYKISYEFEKLNKINKHNEEIFDNSFYSLSKEKKNIIVFMIDRATSSYLINAFKERPELKDRYEGFTYYPNTIGFYAHTIHAYPPLMGGYEYTPFNSDNREDIKMFEKHNESLLLMPLIFKKNNWNVMVSDSPWGNYDGVTDKSLFNKHNIEYENISYQTENQYRKMFLIPPDNIIGIGEKLIYFSFYRVVPEQIKSFFYREGNYINYHKNLRIHCLYDVRRYYSSLYYLSQLTNFKSTQPSIVIINNNLVHSEGLYDETYTLNDNTRMLNVDEISKSHHQNIVVVLDLIGKYIDYLKENNVFDNTRIIIVSDHGFLVDNPELENNKNFNDIIRLNALLMVKDFNSTGALKVNNTFKTTADVPIIAMDGIINNPINPFTGNRINTNKEVKGTWVYTEPTIWMPKEYTGNKPFVEESEFRFVKEDIFKEDNWSEPIKYPEWKKIYQKSIK